jgi:ribonuclease BN (tRNA processing enzyme)
VELDSFLNDYKNNEKNKALIQEYMGFISHADLLIADGQYTKEQYPDKVGWGHTSIPVLLEMAFRSQVKQVAIFHHDPQHSDKFLDELWMKTRSMYRSRGGKMDLFWAREGMTLAI